MLKKSFGDFKHATFDLGDSVNVKWSVLGLYTMEGFGRMITQGTVSNLLDDVMLIDMTPLPGFSGTTIYKSNSVVGIGLPILFDPVTKSTFCFAIQIQAVLYHLDQKFRI